MKIVDPNNQKSDNNFIVGSPIFTNSSIVFEGQNNTLIFEDNVEVLNSNFTFKGDNSLVYISSSQKSVMLKVLIYNDSVIYVGKNCAYNNCVELIVGESKNIIIGDDCLFSSQVIIRTDDAHQIYDIATLKRINQGKSVYIGDHVWCSARVIILKGSMLHSGCLIGSDAVVTGKEVPSNTAWAGNPAKQIRSGILFDSCGTHGITESNESKYLQIDKNKAANYIFSHNMTSVDFAEIETELNKSVSLSEKKQCLLKWMKKNKAHSRFAL